MALSPLPSVPWHQRRMAGMDALQAEPGAKPPSRIAGVGMARTAAQRSGTERSEFLDRQVEAVIRQRMTFYRRRMMNRGEYELFRAPFGVTA